MWSRPAIGGLALGLISGTDRDRDRQRDRPAGQGLGLLGGGYGAVQMAISGTGWLRAGWTAVEILALLSLAKLVAAALTIGSEGSAGDFAPSLAIGGLMGGAFGRALQILLADPRLDPGAFALVGMGVFYGGIAHVPLSALVLVCELAGNYDLLVPLMLAQAIAFVALRKRALYEAQVPTQRDSPVHRDALLLDVLQSMRVRDVIKRERPCVRFRPTTTAREMLQQALDAARQEVFPVVGEDGVMLGLIAAPAMRVLAIESADSRWALAADVMQAPISVRPDDDLRTATQALLEHGLRELPVVDEHSA